MQDDTHINEIDKLINDIIIKLDTKIINTHPNIAKLWKVYFTKKINALYQSAINCNNIISNIESEQNNIRDLSRMDILTMHILHNFDEYNC